MYVLGLSSSITNLLILAVATIIATAVIGAGKSVMGLMRTRQTKARQNEADAQTLSDFFFDKEKDPRTGTPATTGWTTRVDAQLKTLTTNQTHTTKLLNEILYEIQPNGGGNFRGLVEQGVEAAAQERDDRRDGGT